MNPSSLEALALIDRRGRARGAFIACCAHAGQLRRARPIFAMTGLRLARVRYDAVLEALDAGQRREAHRCSLCAGADGGGWLPVTTARPVSAQELGEEAEA